MRIALVIILRCLPFYNAKVKPKETEVFDHIDVKYTTNILEAVDNMNISFIQQNILYYIAGYIVKSLIKRITCNDCIHILTHTNNITFEHTYCSEIVPASSFMKFINRGKLCVPSTVVYNIIQYVEKVFKAELHNGNTDQFKTNIIRITIQHYIPTIMSLFEPRHPVTDTAGVEELHETIT